MCKSLRRELRNGRPLYCRVPYSGPPRTAWSAGTALPVGTWFWPENAAIPITPASPSTMPVTALARTGPAARRGQEAVRCVMATEITSCDY